MHAVVTDKLILANFLPSHYEVRKGQTDFIHEAREALKNNEVFVGSAPCGIGKSLASLLAVLPSLDENKLMICFRTRNQLQIYLKELRSISASLPVVSLLSKQDMCPLRMGGNLSYSDFSQECNRRKRNCKSAIRPYCRFYAGNMKAQKKAEKLALLCAQKILAPDDSVRLLSKQGFCAYEAIKENLFQTSVFLGTFHYVFNPKIRESLLKSLGVGLSNTYLIVDEAHNLPFFAREMLSDKLTRNVVEKAQKENKEFDHKASSSVKDFLDILMKNVFQNTKWVSRAQGLKQINPEGVNELFLERCGVSGLEAARTIQDYGEYIKNLRTESNSRVISSQNIRVGKFMENFFENNGRSYVHLIGNDQGETAKLEVRCLDPREITDPVLRQARGTLLMSGFLSPTRVYRDLMLCETKKVRLWEFDSPFPPENRLILVARDVTSEFKKRDSHMLEKWRDYIQAISETNRGNIAVFFTSYELMHQVLPMLRLTRRKIVENRKTKDGEVLAKLTESRNNAFFGVMGGKFSEGVDYPGNVLTCVVAVGLPYATWDVYQRVLIDYIERKFPNNGKAYAYVVPALLRLVQTCGRVHRSATDRGCTVILDSRISYQAIREQLPNYYQREMKEVSGHIECADRISEFWRT
jgi:DNA excision repair protein ERCC-2